VLDPLCDAGSSCSKSSDLGAMVKVMALGDEDGGNPPCTARPPLERLLPQEQDAPPPEQDTLDIAVVDLRAPRNHIIDPVQVTEALERTHIVLLSKVAEDIDDRRCMSSMTAAWPQTLCCGSKPDPDPAVAIVKPRPRRVRLGRPCSKLQWQRPPRPAVRRQ
jgi:hypothetical protein